MSNLVVAALATILNSMEERVEGIFADSQGFRWRYQILHVFTHADFGRR